MPETNVQSGCFFSENIFQGKDKTFFRERLAFPVWPVAGPRKLYLLFTLWCIKLIKLSLIYFVASRCCGNSPGALVANQRQSEHTSGTQQV